MAVNDVVRLRTHIRLFGQECQIGAHFRYDTAGGNAVGLSADWEAVAVPALAAGMSADASIEAITVESVDPPDLESTEVAVAPVVPGAIAGESLPPANAAVFSLHTGLTGKRRRGRFYLPGLERNHANGGLLDGATKAALDAAAAALVAEFGATGANLDYTMVVFSPEDLTFVNKAGDPAPRVGTLINPVTSIVVDPVARSQRRRQIGVGS